ncbi:hypothetical protein GX563_09680 [Candidatus Bathyarchaeota archaeon]|nr:hypothetical protein [Candidatus Bathyarchaeota archaeon]
MKYYRIPLRQWSMRRFLNSRTALGAPVGNLIILVAAVVLSTTVVLFTTNVTSSQIQKEKLYIATSHIWYCNSTTSIVAIAICDTGATDTVLSKVDVKGLQCQWNGTSNYMVYSKINGTLPGDLPLITEFNRNGNTTVTLSDATYNFEAATEGLTIQSGYTLAFYVVVPNRVMIYDLSTPLRMVITTTQGVYCIETVVQSV